MGLRLHFLDGPRAGEMQQFLDEVTHIDVGRDPDKCQVVFAPDQTQVGRVHCAIRRVLGCHRLGLDISHVVLVDGVRAHDGQELHEGAEIRLGPSGPRLSVSFFTEGDLAKTDIQFYERYSKRPKRR